MKARNLFDWNALAICATIEQQRNPGNNPVRPDRQFLLRSISKGNVDRNIMAGGTHAFDMIKRMKQNEKLRKLPYFKRKQDYHAVEKTLGIEYKSATIAEKELLRAELIKRRIQENRSTLLTLTALLGISIGIVVLILKFLVK